MLLRCRAIENQCYVIAAAQTGQHNVKRRSYGHAMVRYIGSVNSYTNTSFVALDLFFDMNVLFAYNGTIFLETRE